MSALWTSTLSGAVAAFASASASLANMNIFAGTTDRELLERLGHPDKELVAAPSTRHSQWVCTTTIWHYISKF